MPDDLRVGRVEVRRLGLNVSSVDIPIQRLDNAGNPIPNSEITVRAIRSDNPNGQGSIYTVSGYVDRNGGLESIPANLPRHTFTQQGRMPFDTRRIPAETLQDVYRQVQPLVRGQQSSMIDADLPLSGHSNESALRAAAGQATNGITLAMQDGSTSNGPAGGPMRTGLRTL